MRRIKATEIIDWEPCADYPDRLEAGEFGETITIQEIAAKNIPHEDRIWVICEAVKRLGSAKEKKALRMFAADCAAKVLHIYETEYPNDNRPRNAIIAARGNDAAASAAEAAAWDAAWDAARDALAAASAAASDAASAAARASAWAAAWAAAWDAAWARDAASATETAAWAAASAAAWAAAWDAARGAAEAAARDWQLKRLIKWLDGECKPLALPKRKVTP